MSDPWYDVSDSQAAQLLGSEMQRVLTHSHMSGARAVLRILNKIDL
ncbi:MAG: hypothetical protein P4L96_20335 [Rhodoferax sp.]|nr:hypothetical protein [Rhodoferax sp.]